MNKVETGSCVEVVVKVPFTIYSHHHGAVISPRPTRFATMGQKGILVQSDEGFAVIHIGNYSRAFSDKRVSDFVAY